MFYWHLAIALAPVVAGLISTNTTIMGWFFKKYFPEELSLYQDVNPMVVGKYYHHYTHQNIVKFYDYVA